MNIADNLVRWGKVTVSDGDTAIVLTGGYDKRHFPPFLYKTYDMVGAPRAYLHRHRRIRRPYGPCLGLHASAHTGRCL